MGQVLYMIATRGQWLDTRQLGYTPLPSLQKVLSGCCPEATPGPSLLACPAGEDATLSHRCTALQVCKLFPTHCPLHSHLMRSQAQRQGSHTSWAPSGPVLGMLSPGFCSPGQTPPCRTPHCPHPAARLPSRDPATPSTHVASRGIDGAAGGLGLQARELLAGCALTGAQGRMGVQAAEGKCIN